MPKFIRIALASVAATGVLAMMVAGGEVAGQGAASEGAIVIARAATAQSASETESKPAPVAKHIFRMPALSPDGETLAFVYDGDLWRVPSAGGTAHRLTSTLDNDTKPVFSPDGKWLAFASMKFGGYDVYIMPSEGGPSRRITFHGAAEVPFGWTPDSTCVLYESSQLGSGQDMWCVRVAGGEPWPISNGGPMQNEMQCSISPDGKKIAYVGNGRSTGYRQRGYFGSSSNDIWVCDFDGVVTSNHRVYEREQSNSNLCFPVWNSDRDLIWLSFNSGIEGSSLRVGHLKQWRSVSAHMSSVMSIKATQDAREPSKAHHAPKLAFTTGEREGWQLKILNLETNELTVPTIRIDTDTRAADIVVSNPTEAEEFAPSPDGKKVAFVAGADVWVMAADAAGGVPRQVTNTATRERGLMWTADSLSLVYCSRRTGEWQLYLADLVARTERPLAIVPGGASHPTLSNDGKFLIVVGDEKRLVKVPLGDGPVETLIEANFAWAEMPRGGTPYAVSPDGKWVLFGVGNSKQHEQVHVCELATKTVTRITRLYEDCRSASFSTDGKRIVFSNAGETDSDIYAVDLELFKEVFDEDKLDKALEEAGKPAPASPPSNPRAAPAPKTTPVTSINFDDIANRVRRVTSATGNEGSPIGLDDGKTILFLGAAPAAPPAEDAPRTRGGGGGTTSQVMSVSFERGRAGSARALTTSATPKSGLQLSPDGKEVWFKDGGVIQRMKTSGGPATALPFRVRTERTLAELREEGFRECVWIIGDYFYDANMHGVAWKQISERYMEAMRATPTGDEWGSLMNELLGELNSSHQGFTPQDPRNDGFTESPAGLGLEFDAAGLSRGEYRITRALKRGPCDPALAGVLEGQYVTGIDGVPFKAGETVMARMLEGKSGRRVKLHVNGTPDFATSREVSVRAIPQGSESNLQYDAWVDAQRAMVEKLSDGKLGYAHIRGMNRQAVVQFKRDLGNALEGKLGAVIDVRYNGGGNTAVNLLETIIKKPWVKNTARTGETYTANEGSVGALEIPSCLMINQSSFSNAEMIAEGYKRLGLGPVVGWPTGGAVIWTTEMGLVDGSSIRLPFAKVSTVDGENLENIGRQPDVKVWNDRAVLESGRDPQTEAAVAEMLKVIGAGK